MLKAAPCLFLTITVWGLIAILTPTPADCQIAPKGVPGVPGAGVKSDDLMSGAAGIAGDNPIFQLGKSFFGGGDNKDTAATEKPKGKKGKKGKKGSDSETEEKADSNSEDSDEDD